MKTILALILVAILFSCSLDYGQSQLSDEISDEIPDTVLTGVVHTVVRDNVVRFRITADRVEAYSGRNLQVLQGVGFTEYDADGEVRTDGVADSADYQTDTEDVELSGNLRFFSVAEDAWLRADYLYWDSEERQLTSVPEQPVALERGDGTSIIGRGFTAEMDQSLIIFSGGVRGTIVETE